MSSVRRRRTHPRWVGFGTAAVAKRLRGGRVRLDRRFGDGDLRDQRLTLGELVCEPEATQAITTVEPTEQRAELSLLSIDATPREQRPTTERIWPVTRGPAQADRPVAADEPLQRGRTIDAPPHGAASDRVEHPADGTWHLALTLGAPPHMSSHRRSAGDRHRPHSCYAGENSDCEVPASRFASVVCTCGRFIRATDRTRGRD